MSKISPSSIYSTEEKVTESYCILWEIVRRHPDYFNFCQKNKNYFDGDEISFLDEMRLSPDGKLECEKIKKRFRLEHVVYPGSSIPEQTMKTFPFFRDEHSVDPEIMEREDGNRTPIWEDRFVRLRVDIRGFRTKKEILKEIWNCIEWARRIGKIEPAIQRLPNEETFRVWDLKIEGRSTKEIIRTIWPDEYNKEFGSLNDSQKDRLYHKLFAEYSQKGIEDADKQAYAEAYETSGSGKEKLSMRVVDRVNRMEEVFKEFFSP